MGGVLTRMNRACPDLDLDNAVEAALARLGAQIGEVQ